MAAIAVAKAQPTPIRREKGATITFVNQNAGGGTDIYISRDRQQLSGWLSDSAGVLTPAGIKLAAGGTALQYPNFEGLMWARAVADTTLEVLP